jgi:hypothetical protein
MDEVVDPLALGGALVRPGIVEIRLPDPLGSLPRVVLGERPDRSGAERCGGPCGRTVAHGETVYQLPSGAWACSDCAAGG